MNKVVLATATLYNPEKESDQLRITLFEKTIAESQKSGHTLVVADSGSPDSLTSRWNNDNLKLFKIPFTTMGAGRREAIKRAAEIGDVIVWFEPEKHTFVPYISDVSRDVVDNTSDIVIPKRSSFDSYPVSQMHSETFGNILWKELTKLDLDILFGPRVLSKESTKYFLEYNGEYGDLWDAIMIPVLRAARNGRRVDSKQIDFTYPIEQKEHEEKSVEFTKKRLSQLENIIGAVVKELDK